MPTLRKVIIIDGIPNGKCNRCEIIKPINDFVKRKQSPFGHSTTCKVCARLRQRVAKEKDPERWRERNRQWRERNKEHLKNEKRKWHEKNREYALQQRKEYRNAHIERAVVNVS